MKIKYYFLIICLINLVTISTQAVEVVLKEKVVVSSSEIFLEDIADIYPETSDHLKKLYIGRSPLLGKSKVYKQDYIKMRLASQKSPSDIKLKGTEKVLVMRSYQTLDLDELKKKIRDYLIECMEDNQEEIKIEFYQIPKKIELPNGEVKIYVGFNGRPTHLVGNIYVPVRIDVSGAKYKVIKIGVKVRRFSKVVVANKNLELGHILDQADIRLALRETTFLSYDVARDLDLALNKRLTQRVDEGKALCERWIEVLPLVKRGEEVEILSKMDNILIKTKGLAREDGKLEELIKVRNISSKKEVLAKVIEKNIVIIE
ncbi:MAG: flagellar basal body P-ring formation chaperone FlgA [bacterium]